MYTFEISFKVTGEKAAQLRLESTANNFVERLEKSRRDDAAGINSAINFALLVAFNTLVVVGGAVVGAVYLVNYAIEEFVSCPEKQNWHRVIRVES